MNFIEYSEKLNKIQNSIIKLKKSLRTLENPRKI